VGIRLSFDKTSEFWGGFEPPHPTSPRYATAHLLQLFYLCVFKISINCDVKTGSIRKTDILVTFAWFFVLSHSVWKWFQISYKKVFFTILFISCVHIIYAQYDGRMLALKVFFLRSMFFNMIFGIPELQLRILLLLDWIQDWFLLHGGTFREHSLQTFIRCTINIMEHRLISFGLSNGTAVL
jgi:hypothetical protein